MESFTFAAYGLSISSAIDLPLSRGILPGKDGANDPEINSGSDPPADVVIRFGNVPTALDNPIARTPVIQVTRREFLFALPGAGRFLVQNGRDVRVQCESGAAEEMLGLHIAHSGLGAILHQTGRLPLHASAVLVDGGCVAFLGGSHAGKSTIAAALNQRGYSALCDDICAATFDNGSATIRPGTNRLQLWADTARALGWSTDSAIRAHPTGERYGFPVAFPQSNQTFPLLRVYILRETRLKPESISRLCGIDAFKSLFGQTYFAPHLAAFVEQSQAFIAYAGIARSVPFFEWSFARRISRLTDTVDFLEQHLSAAAEDT